MNRKEFIKTCGLACVASASAGMLLQGCMSSKNIMANIVNENIIVPKSGFIKKNEKILDYLIVNNRQLRYPIYVFRFSENEYSALYLQCTHQGYELNAFGDKLVCTAHGSEFDNKGNVTSGPATKPLRSFPTYINEQNIIISLKKA